MPFEKIASQLAPIVSAGAGIVIAAVAVYRLWIDRRRQHIGDEVAGRVLDATGELDEASVDHRA